MASVLMERRFLVIRTARQVAAAQAFADWSENERQQLLNALTRRRFTATAATLAALFGLPAASHAQTPAATPNDGPRTIETVYGPVDVPAFPTRVVCIDSYSIAALVDTGLVPIGIPEIDLDSYIATYKDALQDVPTVGSYQGIDVEQIKVLNPEVILAINAPWATDIHDQLAAIAPTVVFDYDVPNAWQVLADQFTYAIGRETLLDEVKAHYAARTSEIATTYADTLAATTWAVAIGWGAADNQYTLYYPDSAPGLILTDLGARFIAAAAGKSGGNEQFSYERLSLLEDADVLLTYGPREGEPVEDSVAMIEQPLFQALKVAQTGEIYAITNIITGSYGDALNFIDKIESIIQHLAGADATPTA